MNGEYAPGMELCLNPTMMLPDPAAAFHPRGEDHIGENEIRPRYVHGTVEHGALTAGLCSAWQTDLNACLDYWTAEFPNTLEHASAPTERALARPRFGAAGPRMSDPEMLNLYVDMMGVGRNENGDPTMPVETERGPGDDVGPAPSAPFPLEAPR
jgi:hypothetical protein